MTPITPAPDALRQPSARLTDEEADMVEAMCSNINAYLASNMKREGCTMDTQMANPSVWAEIKRRLTKAGWNYLLQPRVVQSHLQGGQNRVVGYQLIVVPTEASYEAADATLQ